MQNEELIKQAQEIIKSVLQNAKGIVIIILPDCTTFTKVVGEEVKLEQIYDRR